MKERKEVFNNYSIVLILFVLGILFLYHLIGDLRLYTYFESFELSIIRHKLVEENTYNLNFPQKLNSKFFLCGLSYHKCILKDYSFRISGISSNFNIYYQIQKNHLYIARLKAG